jgi:hypothetical protein
MMAAGPGIRDASSGGDAVRLCSLLLICVALSACGGEPPKPPPPKQPSVLDKTVAPAVGLLGVKVGPQGGLVLPIKPKP